ncbi:hypothetical protein BDV96DRAFT_644620 [Lophiotrema nucula]|uniref:Uncharacterized protein n=1 Tax=Lophiotrema nucula TaxID=690887 RepID=A0A6A5ZCF2_9PLEO|nr:hypothetical protein BDV96DRAFT_644620 [Lophiotrema nucula]
MATQNCGEKFDESQLDRIDPVRADFRDINHPLYPGSAGTNLDGRRNRKKLFKFLSIAIPLAVIALGISVGFYVYKSTRKSKHASPPEPTTIVVTQFATFTTHLPLLEVPTPVTRTVFVTPTPTQGSDMPMVPADKNCIDMKMGPQDSESDCRKGCDPQSGECINWNDGFWCAIPCASQSSASAAASPLSATDPTTLQTSTSPAATTLTGAPTEKKCVIPYDNENYLSSEESCHKLCGGQDQCVQWLNSWYCAVLCYDGSKPRAGGSVCAPWVSDPDCPISDKNRGH